MGGTLAGCQTPHRPIVKPPLPLQQGDRLQLRKPHACGGDVWQVAQLGAEIGLVCQTCQRRIRLPRAELERRTRRVLPPDEQPLTPPNG